MAEDKNKIVLKDYETIRNEYEAAETITPGALLELNSDGKVQNHSTENGSASAMFAIDNYLIGEGINDDYSSGDKVQTKEAQPGEEMYGILANGENVSVGDLAASNGSGELQAIDPASSSYTAKDEQIVGEFIEAKDLSASADTAEHIKIRIT